MRNHTKPRQIVRRWRDATHGLAGAIALLFAFGLCGLRCSAAVLCDGTPVPVTIVAGTSTISETAAPGGQFIFRLGGPVGNDTHLSLQISGSASNGTDYEMLANQVTLRAGEIQAALAVTPIMDAGSEGSETITVTIPYRILRAPNMTGPWETIETVTAPASGQLEYQDINPLPGRAFYRTAQP